MAIELLQDISVLTDKEKADLVESVSADHAYWDAWDGHVTAGEQIRRVLETEDRASFTRDEVVQAINYAEATRLLSHIVVVLAVQNLEAARKHLSSAICTWCSWTYRDERFDFPADHVLTAEDVAAENARVGVQLREHLKVCPTHPMRELERRLAALEGQEPEPELDTPGGY